VFSRWAMHPIGPLRRTASPPPTDAFDPVAQSFGARSPIGSYRTVDRPSLACQSDHRELPSSTNMATGHIVRRRVVFDSVGRWQLIAWS
jgi:hypothetical protein